MKNKKTLLLLLLFFAAQLAYGQQPGKLTGSVKNADGSPEQGVHVFLIQTTYGTNTGADGSFEINGIPAGDYILAVSKVGFEEQAMPLTITEGDNDPLEIVLNTATYHLDEVAVYGQQRKTFHAIRLNVPLERTPLSLNVVPNEVLQQQQAISLEDALKNVSGVSKFGSYGLSDNINIRGFDIGLAGGPENYRSMVL